MYIAMELHLLTIVIAHENLAVHYRIRCVLARNSVKSPVGCSVPATAH